MFFTTFRTRIYPYLPRAWSSIREAEEGMGVTKSRKNHEKSENFENVFMIFFIIVCSSTTGWGAKSAIVVGAKKFWHFVIGPGLKRRYLGAQKELEGVLGL